MDFLLGLILGKYSFYMTCDEREEKHEEFQWDWTGNCMA